jgi:hypothetical protein
MPIHAAAFALTSRRGFEILYFSLFIAPLPAKTAPSATHPPHLIPSKSKIHPTDRLTDL